MNKIGKFKFNHTNEAQLIADVLLKINQIVSLINRHEDELRILREKECGCGKQS